MIDKDSWLDYCRRFIVAYLHLALEVEYKHADVYTESTGKIISQCFGTAGEVPSWLIDVCREIARPMVHDKFVYIPWLNADFDSSDLPVNGFGFDVTATLPISIWCKQIGVPSRVPKTERLMPSPLFVSDAQVVYTHDEIQEWRYDACLALRHLVNCTRAYSKNGINRPVLRKTNRGQKLVILRRPNGFYDNETFTNELTAPVPVDLMAMYPPWLRAQMYGRILNSIMTGTLFEEQIVGTRLIFFEMMDVDLRIQMGVEWFQSMSGGIPGLPKPTDLKPVWYYGINYSCRFPSEANHSSTPPSRGAQKSTWKSGAFKQVSNSQSSRAKRKKKRSAGVSQEADADNDSTF